MYPHRNCASVGSMIAVWTALAGLIKPLSPMSLDKSDVIPTPDTSSASRFTANAVECSILSQSGGSLGTVGGNPSLI
jgi:hypothetical protein